MRLKLSAKLKKRLLVISITLFTIIVLIVAFISPIAKYLIEKYDEKYTGRQITVDGAYVNPFTGYIHLTDLKIKELKNDSIFFSSESVSIDMALMKLFSETYEISQLTLKRPVGNIIQKNRDLNFDDIITLLSPKRDSTIKRIPLRFNVLSIKIIDGTFYYKELVTPINYSIRHVNIESEGKLWNADTINATYNFSADTGSGTVKGNLTINAKTNDYRFVTVVKKFDLKIIQQYLKALTNFGNFSANLDADVIATGNFLDGENINTTGIIAINDLHLGKTLANDYVAFEKLTVDMIQLSPKNKKYMFDSISLVRPFLKYERYDYLDNIQHMFGKEGANISAANAGSARFNLVIVLGNYIKKLAKNFFRSNYKINRLAAYDGDLHFDDYAIGEKFSVNLTPFTIISDTIDKSRKRVEAHLTTGIKPYGTARANLSINPNDSGDFDFHYSIQKVPAAIFNPYTIYLTSYPLDRGTIEFKGDWHVMNSIIQSRNRLTIIDPRLTGRLRNRNSTWLPMSVIMAIVRERGNVIDYEIPVTGNMSDPNFHFRDLVVDIIENIFVKPVTTPYIVRVKNIEAEIEQSLTLKWNMSSSELQLNQERFLRRMARYLEDNPTAFITIHPQYYTEKEKEYILLYEAKKKYYLAKHNKKSQSFDESDRRSVEKMSIKDTQFVRYLNQHTKGNLLFTVQEKCALIISRSIINNKLKALNNERIAVFMAFFKDQNVQHQIKIAGAKNIIPYNGFSFYKIDYKGEIPQSLLNAYSDINDLNERAPRKRFKKERNKNKQ